MAAPLVASAPINSASPGPELARSTDCGPGNQVIPEGHTLTHRSLDGVDVSRLTQCEAQAKVKELDAQSDQLDFDLLETYRRKVFAKGLRMHYDHAQGTILAKNHWYEALSNPNISERGKQKIYAATWHRANEYMNDNHDISFEVKSCLNAWYANSPSQLRQTWKMQRADIVLSFIG